MYQDILKRQFLSNSVESYMICLLIFLGVAVTVKIFKSIILHNLKKIAQKTQTTFDDFLIHSIERALVPLFYFGAFYLSFGYLRVNPGIIKMVNVLGVILLTIFGIRFLLTLIDYFIDSYLKKQEIDEKRKRNLKGLSPVIKIIIWGFGIVFLLDNLGFKISTVVAGLGIGGIAVALAAQAVLGDLFSYFSILLDRPFELGDFVITGDHLGTIEYIGIKTTRIRSLGGEQIILSNTDLTSSRVRNYKRMEKRRVVFSLGVTYQTKHQYLKEIPQIIKNAITSIDKTVFDRAHFLSYGDFSLNFEIVYYVLSSDYNVYMDIQQKINLAIHEEFEKQKIDFAYPTQTLFVNKT